MKNKLFASLGLGVLLAAGGACFVCNGPFTAKAEDAQTRRIYLNASACIAEVSESAEHPVEKFAFWYWGNGVTSTWGVTSPVEGKAGYFYADVPEAVDNLIVGRFNYTQEELGWGEQGPWNKTDDIASIGTKNYVKLTGYTDGTMNYEISERAKVTVMNGEDVTAIDFYNVNSEDPYKPSVNADEGKYVSYFVDSEHTLQYVPAVLTTDTVIYAAQKDLENTATLYIKKYDSWADYKLYVWEAIEGKTYYLRGAWDNDSTKLTQEVYNVKFDGDGMLKVTFKYHDINNVKMIYHDGTDEHKSNTCNLVDNAYVQFGGEPGDLAFDTDKFLGADMAYAICSKMTETGVSTAYGERDYTICSIKNNEAQKAELIEKYNALKTNEAAKAAFDAATLNTFVYGEGETHYENYGAVSFIDVMNEIAGYDIVGGATAGSSLTIANSMFNPATALIVFAGIVCLGAGAMVVLKKKKLAK